MQSSSPLSQAQIALDRLDFKTAERLCTDIIDSPSTSDHLEALLIRSSSLGKRFRSYEAVEDVEKALKKKRNLRTHLRATYAYLELARHHLELAQAEYDNDQRFKRSSLLESHFEQLDRTIKESKALEIQDPLTSKLQVELFSSVLSLCDTNTVALSTGVSTRWREMALVASAPFRTFKSTGRYQDLLQRLAIFQERGRNSMQEIELNVNLPPKYEKVPNPSNIYSLQTLLLPSSSTIKSLAIYHDGKMGPDLFKCALSCSPSLKYLSSKSIDKEHPFSSPSFLYDEDYSTVLSPLQIPPTWKSKLQALEWYCSEVPIRCDDALVSALQASNLQKLQLTQFCSNDLALASLPSLKLFHVHQLQDVASGDTSQEEACSSILRSLRNLPNLQEFFFIIQQTSLTSTFWTAFIRGLTSIGYPTLNREIEQVILPKLQVLKFATNHPSLGDSSALDASFVKDFLISRKRAIDHLSKSGRAGEVVQIEELQSDFPMWLEASDDLYDELYDLVPKIRIKESVSEEDEEEDEDEDSDEDEYEETDEDEDPDEEEDEDTDEDAEIVE